MNMFARFDENPAMTLEDIKETKRYGRTDTQIFSEPNSFMHMVNVSTLYRKSIKLFHQKLW